MIRISTIICQTIFLIGVGLLLSAEVVVAQDDNYNWSQSKVYSLDDEGNIVTIGESKSYSNGFGKLLQKQYKSFTYNSVFAAQPVYDKTVEL